ncbi:OmpA family protein [Alloyangia pacifica]|uniref:OmpA family protein n=1 Tax=Alloyangia pacifica TaxID=311180 RepID=UPI001CFE6ACD|nr:OmpA family protein [Alloyangia pacifica]
MTRGLLKSTTMLALAASLAMPVHAQGQQAGPDCAQTPDAGPCQDKDAKGSDTASDEAKETGEAPVTAETEADVEKPVAEGEVAADVDADGALDAAEAPAESAESAPAEKAPAAAAEAAPAPQAEADAAPEQPAAEQQAEEVAPAAPEAQADSTADAAAPAQTDAQDGNQRTAEAPDDAPAVAEEAETVTAEPAPTSDAPATEGDAAQVDELKKELGAEQAAEGEATVDEVTPTAEAETQSAQTPSAETAAEGAETEMDAQAQAEQPQPEAQAEAEGSAETDELRDALKAQEQDAAPKADAPATAEATATDPAPSAEADAEAEATAGAEAEAEPTAEATDAPIAEPKEDKAAADAEPEAPSDEQQAEAVAREEEQARPAAAAASSEERAGDAELVEETLTDEDVRSSDEDFATDLRDRENAEQQAAETARAERDDDDDDDGLSNFEKAALVGLGTFALSQILDDGAQVVQNTGDRVVVEQDGQYRVLRNDDVLLRQPGSDVKTYRYDDGSTRTVVAYDDGTSVETIKTAEGRVLRRARILPDGQQVVLFDDTQSAQQVVVSELPQARTQRLNFRDLQGEDLAAALAAQEAEGVDRAFSLNQIRNIDRVRHLVPEISVDTVTFQTNSAAIRPGEAEELAALGNAMKRMIEENPSEVFLIEGHTDATGPASYNLALSDRRAESVALALTEYFDVPAANMVLQGYGESDLAVETQADERENRRAAVRRITPLLQGS